jgi:hypothetical protein
MGQVCKIVVGKGVALVYSLFEYVKVYNIQNAKDQKDKW